MSRSGKLTDVWELRVGDKLAPMGLNTEIEVAAIRRTGSQRFTWHITWTDGRTTKHNVTAKFNVIERKGE